MQELFLELVKLSLAGSLFALVVMLVRGVFCKAPKWILCLLWGLVALRLILPISIESKLSLMPDAVASGQIITDAGNDYVGHVDIIHESSPGYNEAVQAGRQPVYADTGYYVVTEKGSYDAPPTVEETVYPVLSWVWLTGMVMMLSYLAVSYLVLHWKMAEATHLRENIWQCGQVVSPFVLGVIRPRIYLPYRISQPDLQNVIAHEQAHIQRKDHWWKPTGFLLLCIHWWNPVLWAAYILLCRDIEAACDEKVIKHMSKDEMRTYSTALLNCSIHRGRITACPLAFGETGVKERIKHVMNYKKPAFWIIVLAIVASAVVGVLLLTDPVADPDGNTDPIAETYTYTPRHKNYLRPATVDGWSEKDALMTENEDGTFFCFTADTAQADDFVNTQRTLLRYLRELGVETGQMAVYGTDYGYCFSQSSSNGAYIDLAATRTWQQVLVTLQTIWGDYTDYGYVYAISNTIAGELGWQTDSAPSLDQNTLDIFFSENAKAVYLLYPSFTTKFASKETANNCKALAVRLFAEIEWRDTLSKPIEQQLDDYCTRISDYAQSLSIPFNRQPCGYAYYGEAVPLRIMTPYAELIIDANYKDVEAGVFGDYFSDYASIYQTANILNEEISASVARLGLEDEAGVMTIKFLNNEHTSTEKYVKRAGSYFSTTETAYVTSLWLYLHQYHEHLAYIMTKDTATTWQSQAFCEIGSTHSQYFLRLWEYHCTHDDVWADIFTTYAGRPYQSGLSDFYELMDILCYSEAYYELVPNHADPMHSITRYLMDRYGEEAVTHLMLYPDTVEAVTGKTWDILQSEWEQHIRETYADVDIPD